MKDRIIAFLAQGLLPAKVSEIVGCSEAYISEVKSSPSYEKLLAEAKLKHKRSEHDEKMEDSYMRLESKVLKHMEENLPFAEFGELANVMDKLIRRKQTHVPVGGITFNNTQNNVTFLTLPKAAMPELQMNSQKEIISMNGKSLAPMSSQGVRKLFDNLAKRKASAEDAVIVKEEKAVKEITKQIASRAKMPLDEEDDTHVG